MGFDVDFNMNDEVNDLHYKHHVFVCTNQKAAGKKCCASEGGESFADYLKKKLCALNMHGPGKIRVSQSGCLGRCKLGPCMVIYPEGIWYTYHSFEDIDEIISQHFVARNVVKRLEIKAPLKDEILIR